MATKEVDPNTGEVSNKRRFDQRDWDFLADFGIEEYHRRKEDRKDREKAWKEIDRQIAMEPEVAYKYIIKGGSRVLDTNKTWMAETEMPFQAEALEVLNADAYRFRFPDTGNWFKAHAETTDDYYKRVNFESLILGDQTEVPSKINQDNADKLVEGFLINLMKQTAFYTRVNRVDAESFKYGMGVARARVETKNVYIDEARGVRKETQKIPVFVPCSIKKVYLDDPISSMHSSQVLGPMQISVDYMKLENLLIAANKGSDNPDDADGGWMPQQLKGILPDDKGYVTVIELEGDIVVPRKTVRSMVLPGAIATILLGGKDSGGAVSRGVIRFRWRKYPFSSYLLFPYHYEGATETYPTSPLMKGRPVQILASDAANRSLDSAMLKIGTPVSYDSSDQAFAQSGGPVIQPFAQWPSMDKVTAHIELGGDPSAMVAMFNNATNLYAQLTGVLPARLGAQTVSHTTAYAKGTEIQQGAVRTIKYVNSTGHDAMVRWLDMAYQMGRDALGKDKVSFFIDAYNGFVEIDKSHLPDEASFDWLGAGGPQDEALAQQAKINSLNLALKMDQMAMSMGMPPTVSIKGAIQEVLREGGWSDLDAITSQMSPGQTAAASLGPGPTVAAIQNLQTQQPG